MVDRPRTAEEDFPGGARLREEFAGLETRLAEPELHTDLANARRVGRRYAELSAVVHALSDYDQLQADLEAASELAEEDSAFIDELEALRTRRTELTDVLTRLMAPRDPNDSSNALVEIKSGEGGEESALFAADLLRMYGRYAESAGWRLQVLDAQHTDLGGYRSVTFAVSAGPGNGPEKLPYGTWKFEGGVHRVQRVPVTESQGRIHTSAAGVLVMPEVETDEVEIADDDLRIDLFRASGPGGQGVNTTDSAVRITHLPTGLQVSCQNERSQLQNRDHAMRLLRTRLVALAAEQAASTAADARRSQVRTVDRSERIRTYNFPENRITDHRIGFKAHNLDQVLDGELAPLIAALAEADLRARLAAVASERG